MRNRSFVLGVTAAALAGFAGCGGSDGNPASTVAPSRHTAAVATSTAADLRLNDRLRARIQRNVARTGSPADSDGRCRKLKLRYGPTADVARKHSEQIARQLHILCPQYFVPL